MMHTLILDTMCNRATLSRSISCLLWHTFISVSEWIKSRRLRSYEEINDIYRKWSILSFSNKYEGYRMHSIKKPQYLFCYHCFVASKVEFPLSILFTLPLRLSSTHITNIKRIGHTIFHAYVLSTGFCKRFKSWNNTPPPVISILYAYDKCMSVCCRTFLKILTAH